MLAVRFYHSFFSHCSKKIFFLLIMISSMSYTEAHSENTYKAVMEAWAMNYNGHPEKAIRVCNELLEDPSLPKVDRMHILIARSMFWLSIEENDKWKKDQEDAENLTLEDEECRYEFIMYYS